MAEEKKDEKAVPEKEVRRNPDVNDLALPVTPDDMQEPPAEEPPAEKKGDKDKK